MGEIAVDGSIYPTPDDPPSDLRFRVEPWCAQQFTAIGSKSDDEFSDSIGRLFRALYYRPQPL